MSVRVHKIVSKAELEGGRMVKTEIHPDDGWVLVDGARDTTVIHRFRLREDGYQLTDWAPNDAIRVRTQKQLGGDLEISLDREDGGDWWSRDKLPQISVLFRSVGPEKKIRLVVRGGDLKEPIPLGEVDLLPAAKPTRV